MARRIALLQLDPTVGDLDGNRSRIEALVAIADAAGADVAIATELAISGYPPRDLLLNSDLPTRSLSACAGIETKLPLLLGCPLPARSERERPANGVVKVLTDGSAREVARKQLLPTYEVFDEARYFSPGNSPGIARDVGGLCLGVTICEDAWQHAGKTPIDYESDPIQQLTGFGKELDASVNLSASPFHIAKSGIRKEVVQKAAKTLNHPFLLVNQVGGNDDLLFDGRSIAAWPNGEIIEAPAWQEGVLLVDLDTPQRSSWIAWAEGISLEDNDDLLNSITMGLSDYCRKSGLEKVVLGLSGGIDSAVTAAIASIALGPENVIGISMPSRISSQHSIDDAKKLAENLGIEYQTRSIEELHQTADQNLADELQSGHPVAAENLQARLRGLIVMAVANSRGAMALATGNKSELAQGYCTLYGDMAGGYAPLGDLYKTEVYQLAALINKEQEIIPDNSITKPPSAELAPDQKDDDTLPPYELLDEILKAYIEEGKTVNQLQELGFDSEIVDEVISRLINNEHKRWQMPPAPRVSSRAFGQGWRQPLASKRT